ncbi:MAG TPA: trypsin-like peptidase domain-containing protein [Anaerolineales bacterium]|nr:trypsin-like peptidase domain-containing protein [Anaerolineales bacterium]
MSKKFTLSIAVAVVMISMLACQLSGLVPPVTTVPVTVPTPNTVPGGSSVPSAPVPSSGQTVDLVGQQDKLVAIYQAVVPGVVTVQTSNDLGSGIVYNSDGYIVTNAHVVGSETKVEVDFTDGTKVYGNVVGTDQYSDLAAIKVTVPASELHPLTLGDSSTLKIGQTVSAIGDPLLLTGSMTTGIVSAVGRSLPGNVQVSGSTGYYTTGDIIQTDALVNPGNSGGPLIDLNGQVVGIVWAQAINSSSGVPSASGIGYAISIDTVKRVIPQLIKNGKFAYPYLGLSLQDNLPLAVIDALGLKSSTGVYVAAVVAGGPGDKAGIKAGTTTTSYQNLNAGGDLIIAVDGQNVITEDDLMRYLLLNKSPGDTITLTVLRGDQKVDIKLVLGTRPAS